MFNSSGAAPSVNTMFQKDREHEKNNNKGKSKDKGQETGSSPAVVDLAPRQDRCTFHVVVRRFTLLSGQYTPHDCFFYIKVYV